MSTNLRIDLLGLAELDSRLAPEGGFGFAELDSRLAPEGGFGFAELDSRLAPESIFPEHIGLPDARSARIESRRAFVEMKQLFMRAVENLEHRKGAWLRAQVRAAEDPIDLWLLRGPLLATLREDDVATRTMRAALYRTLDRTFPEAFGSAEISALNTMRI